MHTESPPLDYAYEYVYVFPSPPPPRGPSWTKGEVALLLATLAMMIGLGLMVWVS